MKRRTRIIALFLLAGLLTGLVGCGRQQEGFAFSAAVVGHPASFDPALAASEGEELAAVHLYENLLRLQTGENGPEIVGGMARDWERRENADGTETYTFHLRTGVKWSDGRAVQAGDFVYAWQHLAAESTGALRGNLLDMVAGYEGARAGDPDALQVFAKDKTTLEVVLQRRCPYFLRVVCTAAATMPRRADLPGSSALVGNGPYAWGGYTGGVLTLTASENYYDRRRLGSDTITIRYCDTAEQAAALLENGEVDFACNLDRERDGWRLVPSPEVTLLIVNEMAQQLESRPLRQALSLAIDRAGLAELAKPAIRTPATGLVPDGVITSGGGAFRREESLCIDNSDYEKNCEQARELLEKEGITGGVKDLTVLCADTESDMAAAEAICAAWREQLGLTASVVPASSAELAESLFRGTFRTALIHFSGDRNDAEAFLDIWQSGRAENKALFHDNAYDILLRMAASTSSVEARDAYLTDAERLLLEQGNVMPLYFTGRAWQMRSGLTGLFSDGLGGFSFRGVRPAAD